jgi:hypothetical protein
MLKVHLLDGGVGDGGGEVFSKRIVLLKPLHFYMEMNYFENMYYMHCTQILWINQLPS